MLSVAHLLLSSGSPRTCKTAKKIERPKEKIKERDNTKIKTEWILEEFSCLLRMGFHRLFLLSSNHKVSSIVWAIIA